MSYISQTGTNQTGLLTFAWTRDPTSFIEAAGSQAAPTENYSSLTQTIPNVVCNVYKNISMDMPCADMGLKPCEILATAPTPINGDLAYLRETFAGRLAALSTIGTPAAAFYGQLWLEGEVELYNPTVSFLSIAATITNTNSSLASSHCYSKSSGKFLSRSELCPSSSSRSDEKKDSDLKYPESVSAPTTWEHLSEAEFIQPLSLPPSLHVAPLGKPSSSFSIVIPDRASSVTWK